MPRPLLVHFVAGLDGPWRITRIASVVGASLPSAERQTVLEAPSARSKAAVSCSWELRGVTSHTRYTTRAEVGALAAVQEGLNRATATCAALIPIRKNEAWWTLAQDERRAILEERSHHIRIGMDYLPAIARRLHHARELDEGFDFITWFEYAPEHAARFEELLGRLRETEEWRFVDREVDVRLVRELA